MTKDAIQKMTSGMNSLVYKKPQRQVHLLGRPIEKNIQMGKEQEDLQTQNHNNIHFGTIP